MNSMKSGKAWSISGAPSNIASVIPVRLIMYSGSETCGSTKVENSPKIAPPRTAIAPISVMAQPLAGDAPVVSKSKTINVTSANDASFLGVTRIAIF